MNKNELKKALTDKALSELSLAELQELTRNNLKFRDLVYQEVYERQCDFMYQDYLIDFPGDYEYSCVYCTKVSLSKKGRYGLIEWEKVLEWLEEIQHNYEWLYRENQLDAVELCKKACEINDRLNYYDLSDENINRMEKRLDEIQKEIEKQVENAIDLELDSCDDIDFLCDELEYLDYFVDDMYINPEGTIYKITKKEIA